MSEKKLFGRHWAKSGNSTLAASLSASSRSFCASLTDSGLKIERRSRVCENVSTSSAKTTRRGVGVRPTFGLDSTDLPCPWPLLFSRTERSFLSPKSNGPLILSISSLAAAHSRAQSRSGGVEKQDQVGCSFGMVLRTGDVGRGLQKKTMVGTKQEEKRWWGGAIYAGRQWWRGSNSVPTRDYEPTCRTSAVAVVYFKGVIADADSGGWYVLPMFQQDGDGMRQVELPKLLPFQCSLRSSDTTQASVVGGPDGMNTPARYDVWLSL